MTLVAAPALRDALERYMREEHVAEVLATGCFTGAHFDRTPDGFRTSYLATSRARLDEYLDRHAPALRDAFARHFPEGVTATRQVLETLRRWD